MTLISSEFFAHDLLRLVERQDSNAPLTKQLEDALHVGPGYGRAWYRTQREHWLRWLEEYHTAGPYERSPTPRTQAQVVYSRIICPPMVFWLAETFGVDHRLLSTAHVTAVAAPKNQASQSGAIRSVLPWDVVYVRIRERDTHRIGFVRPD